MSNFANQNNTLSDKRKQWEGNKEVVFSAYEIQTGEMALTICREAESKNFTCIRYFTVGGMWTAAIDHQAASLHEAFNWLHVCSIQGFGR